MVWIKCIENNIILGHELASDWIQMNESNPGTDSLTPTLLQLTQYFMSHRWGKGGQAANSRPS